MKPTHGRLPPLEMLPVLLLCMNERYDEQKQPIKEAGRKAAIGRLHKRAEAATLLYACRYVCAMLKIDLPHFRMFTHKISPGFYALLVLPLCILTE